MATSKKTWTRESFLAAAAKVIWEIHQAKKLRDRVSDALGNFGIGVPEDATGDAAPAFTMPPADPPETYIGGGLTLADLTPEAKAKREAKQVTQLRQQVYDTLRALARQSTCARGPDCPNHGQQVKAAEIVRHFGALDFPQPQTKTFVEGYYLDGDNGQRYVNVTVDGEMSEAEAKAKLESIASHSRSHEQQEAAFPGTSQEPLTASVYVRPHVTWADTDDIK